MDKTHDIEQQKLLKLFKIIWLLSQPRGKTISQLVELLDISQASVYRYLAFLEETDFFDIEKKGKHRIIYDKLNGKGFLNIKLDYDELDCISEALNHTFPERDISRGIQTKLFQYMSFGLKSQSSILRNTPVVIRDLHEAMQNKLQVKLEYFSANNGTLDKRTVEPLDFIELHRYLIVYDPDAHVKITNLKTSRIQSVEILTKRCTQYSDSIKGIDVFDIACYKEQYTLILDMTPLAYRLMMEEYPRTEPCFEPLNTEGVFKYRFVATVYSFLPIARFILGLPGHVHIVEPYTLVEDIQKKMKNFIVF
jgi:predicted DNA-binding transcriptional regulator YafY